MIFSRLCISRNRRRTITICHPSESLGPGFETLDAVYRVDSLPCSPRAKRAGRQAGFPPPAGGGNDISFMFQVLSFMFQDYVLQLNYEYYCQRQLYFNVG